MFCLTSESDDPFFNLALEEYLLKNRSDDFFITYINNPSVIIGKHQSPHREANTQFISKNHIPVIRRITGGGTVFHDKGNLNFSFIMQSETGKQVNFRLYTKPVIDFLESIGISARFEGKNDLKVNGLKISGNAEHVFRNRVLHHGTLLFSTSQELISKSLRKNTSCYTTRAVNSNPSAVTSICEMLPGIQSIEVFRDLLNEYIRKKFPGTINFKLSSDEILHIKKLAENKFRSWEWNFAYGPEYQFNSSFMHSWKPVVCQLYIREGTIRECILEGSSELLLMQEKLIGCRHMPDEIAECFRQENFHLGDEEVYNFF
jgi:lipoate---protein ligase